MRKAEKAAEMEICEEEKIWNIEGNQNAEERRKIYRQRLKSEKRKTEPTKG